jgi:3-hydroxyacyl-CoA dehydrogenase/enoyl-CoA hydratase/3-hydroxybutyryl-CoA epimerase
LQLILGGRRLNAGEALRWGLADDFTDENDQEPPALSEPRKRPRLNLPLGTWRERTLESNRLGRWLIFRGARHVLERRLPDDMPAPWEALEAVKIGIQKGMAAGLAYEREAIGRLATSPACRHLVDLFSQREQARKAPAIPEGRSPIRRVGIIGAGTMGAGIAQLAVLHGCEVVVREANEMALGVAMLRLMALLQRAVDRGVLPASELNNKLAQIHGTTAWKGFENVDLVIEAVTEDLSLKRKLFHHAENNTAANTILASNTSSLRIQDLQEGLDRPERVAGLHFFNPVHKMPLVEVVRTPATSQGVVDLLTAWAVAIGKTPLVVKDSPGFVVNRVLMPYLNEAVALVSEGMSIERVDEAMRKFGMPMGPLEVLDQIGLDVGAHVALAVAPVFGERLQLQPAFALMAERKWLGVKTKTGFYRYRGRKKRINRLAVNALRAASTSDAPYRMEALSRADQLAEIRERLVLLMVNEAARCLEAGLAENAAAIDLAMVLGSGWAPHRGGPLCYARERGTETVVESLVQLAQRLGERYEPCDALRRLP